MTKSFLSQKAPERTLSHWSDGLMKRVQSEALHWRSAAELRNSLLIYVAEIPAWVGLMSLFALSWGQNVMKPLAVVKPPETSGKGQEVLLRNIHDGPQYDTWSTHRHINERQHLHIRLWTKKPPKKTLFE